MSKQLKKYYFIDKEKLKSRSKDLAGRIEKMSDNFNEFTEILIGLAKDPYIDFSYLGTRAGLTEKLLEKVSKAIEKYRDLYFSTINDIFQTRIEDFTKKD